MKTLTTYNQALVWGMLWVFSSISYAAAPGGVQTKSSAPGIYYQLREGYDSTPENGIGNGFFRARGYVDNFIHPDDAMLNEDSQSISIRALTNLTINSGGNYRVRFESLDDDGAIFVNGTNRVTGNCCGNRESGNFNLSAGTHSLEVRWSENSGGETLRVQYLGPDTGNSWADIPSSRMNASNLSLAAWYRADAGVGNSGNNTNATSWNDQSGKGNNLSTQSGHDPKYHSTTSSQLLNFNPVINFTNDRMNGPDYNNGLSIDRAGRTVIAVADRSDTGAEFRWLSGYGRDNADRARFALARNGSAGRVAVNNGNIEASNVWQTNTPAMVMGRYESDRVQSGNNVSLFQNGQSRISARHTDWRTQLNDNADIAVGTTPDAGDGWIGRIAEVIYYPWALDANERRSVFSYLGIKYGISPHASLNTMVNSQGTTIFDIDDNNNGSPNWYYVAGIMRDDGSNLNQRISKSQSDYSSTRDGHLTVSTDNNFTNRNTAHANTLSNGQSLVWGGSNHNISNMVASVDTSLYARRSQRFWKFTDVGGVGNVHLKFDNLPALPPNGRYVLIRDTNTNFSSGTTELATSTNGVFNNINFPDNQTFYVAVAIRGESVMGVGQGNMRLWLRADRGTTLSSNNRVTSWEDRTAFHNDANTAVADTSSAAFVSGDASLNYNASIRFDGTEDYYNFGTSGFSFGTSSRTTFIVHKPNTTSGNRFPYSYGTNATSDGYYLGAVVDGGNLRYGSVSDNFDVSSFWQSGRAAILQGQYNGSTATIYSAGESLGSRSESWNTIANVAYLGRHPNGSAGNSYSGDFAEVIEYNKVLSQTERKYVETYLALKYGVTLHASTDTYVDDDRGGALFDVDDNNDGTQDWDLVAGIFREQDANFVQKIATAVVPQDSSLQTSLIVSGGSDFTSPNSAQSFSIGQNDYLIWGAKPVPITDMTSTDFDSTAFDGRLDRIWKFQDTGAVGAVNMKFQHLESMGDGGQYFLLQSSSQSFASGYTVLSTSNNGEFYNINLPNGGVRYLALAFVRGQNAPVTDGLRVWLRGDVEYTGTGTETKPFTSLSAASQASDGVYYFDIAGTAFSTYVEKGWIMVANGFASTVPGSPGYTQYTNLDESKEGILSSSVITNAFNDVFEVRISSESGPAPHVDMRSANNTVITRFKAYDPLSYAPGENYFWKGPGSEVSIGCNGLGSYTSLEKQIFHSCGGGGLHWIPGRGNRDENTARANSTANDLRLWARAPHFTHGDKVSVWKDRSGNRLHAEQPDKEKQPKIDSNSINFHSAVSFRGNSALYRSASDVLNDSGDDASTIFAVIKRSQVTSGRDDVVSFTGGGINATQDRPAIGVTNNRIHATIFDGTNSTRENSVGDALIVDQPYILSSRIKNNTSGSNGVRLAVNGFGGEQIHTLGNPVDASSSAMVIGAENNNLNDALDADVAEILIYDRVLADGEYQKVNTYLALKYGITFRITSSSTSHQYRREDGVSIFDLDDNNDGNLDWYRSAALFKSESGAGDQRIGRSQEDGAALTMSVDLDFANPNQDHADVLTPKQYLIWASNNEDITTTNTSNIDTSKYAYRLARQWKVRDNGGVPAVNLFIDTLPEIEDDQEYVLLLSNSNNNFTSATELGRATGGVGIFANVNFPNGTRYITVAVTPSQQDGSVEKPYKSLRSARQNNTSGGYRHFDLSGQQFSTWVQSNGWVLLAAGDRNTATGNYSGTDDLLLASDQRLRESVFYNLKDIEAVRIQAANSPSALNISSTSPLVIARLRSFQTLTYRTGEHALWSGTYSSFNITCNGTSGKLHQHIVHSCGDTDGLQWQPNLNRENPKLNEGKADLRLWVRGTNSIVSSPSGVRPYQSKLRIAEAQVAVLDYAAKVAIQNSPLLSDFIDAGLLNVTEENLAMIVARLGQLSGEDISLISDLQARINAIIALEARLLNGDTEITLAELEALGFEGITAENFAIIMAIIDENALAIANGEYGLIQALIDDYNALVILLEAIQLSDTDAITFDALSAISTLLNLEEDNLAWYQEVLINNSASITTLDDIQTYIDLANALVVQLDSTDVLLTQSQWAQLGITIEDESVLDQIVAALSGVSDLSGIQTVVDQVIEENATEPEIPNFFAEIPVEQFALFGLVGVTAENYDQVTNALFQAYLLNSDLLLVTSEQEFIDRLQPIIDSVINNPLQILWSAIANNDGSSITLDLLLIELGMQNILASHIEIYQDILVTIDESELATELLLQTVIDNITNHIYALIEIREDAAFGNANQQSVSSDQLNQLIGVDYIIATLLDEYQEAITSSGFSQDALPSITAIQDLIIQVNDGNRNKDSDGDGITDLLETLLGFDETDMNIPVVDGNRDADHDGLTAAQEYLLGTDDLSIDSDSQHTAQYEMNNAIYDDLEDIDNDQLPNILELNLGYDPTNGDEPIMGGANNSDSDDNGIHDTVEAFLNMLGILNIGIEIDSDADGVTDVEEVSQGTDPRKSSVIEETTSEQTAYITTSSHAYGLFIILMMMGWLRVSPKLLRSQKMSS